MSESIRHLGFAAESMLALTISALLGMGARPSSPSTFAIIARTMSALVQEERVQCLWRALEKVIPDIRQRTELTLIGTPLTHERYLNRHRGTYGPAISAADSSFPGPATDIPGLYRSDSVDEMIKHFCLLS